MTFYIRLAFTSGLALRIKGAAYFTKSKLSETDNSTLSGVNLADDADEDEGEDEDEDEDIPKRKSCRLQCPEESLVRQEGSHSWPHDVAAKLERQHKNRLGATRGVDSDSRL
jgi:hypothetical protein